MATHQDDLDLLLSLQDKVLETPPISPSSTHHQPQSPDYFSNHGSPRRTRETDMSVFKDAVQDYLCHGPIVIEKYPKFKRENSTKNVDIEKFSGLKIKKLLVSTEELSDHFSDIRFVRLSAIRNLLKSDKITGCWATVGVLAEKGNPRITSNGKNYCIWKIGCLDENVFSVFLFGDAYNKHWKEQAGTVFGLFNCSVRKDAEGSGFSLSVSSAGQILKMGASADYVVCKGKRKDGVTCTMTINRQDGAYCKFHKSNASQKYVVTRPELRGGNLRAAFRDHRLPEGVYMVDPLADKKNLQKCKQPVKLLSVDGLKKALGNGAKVTTTTHSQGLRFLAEISGKPCLKIPNKGSTLPNKQKGSSENRLSSAQKLPSTAVKKQPEAKRMKTVHAPDKMIELDLYSSDEA